MDKAKNLVEKKTKPKKAKSFEQLTEDQQVIATALGFSQIFSERDTVQQCYDYAGMVDPRAVVACGLLQNTMALYVSQHYVLKPKGKG